MLSEGSRSCGLGALAERQRDHRRCLFFSLLREVPVAGQLGRGGSPHLIGGCEPEVAETRGG